MGLVHHYAREWCAVSCLSNLGGARRLQNTILQLRKICNHPFLFPEIESTYARHKGLHSDEIEGLELIRASGKVHVLDRVLLKLKQAGHKVLLFCQMTKLMSILEETTSTSGLMDLKGLKKGKNL